MDYPDASITVKMVWEHYSTEVPVTYWEPINCVYSTGDVYKQSECKITKELVIGQKP